MMECHAINAFAPWILIQELKCLLLASPNPDRYIVNVSAMEGQFYRLKSTYHPHTNMAKASLNMLTRTAAAGFKDDGIFMTAVDTGWVTNESPLKRGEEETRAQPPLDELDGAMRVLDPVFSGVRGEDKVWGVFLKNYQPTKW
ncbi:hypothetical protein BCR33DRAFT_755407 [Rhizoclosmatium globosum]|uniref:NAD(P)-binding protein n=1 Tax=Rhizoclosmatium globosum TaxID=329046 RepID=A0A1Y2B0N9_9FUNG|nr:hypothetical protein BCR33DRAFT_755407 [Rhizoclosmatium globosum]|eukprot:ORY28120.1 hypothetical protein BCR33DRAFT_755407 [Rhizoclosmatium globosum]